jgi:hypothetical protein
MGTSTFCSKLERIGTLGDVLDNWKNLIRQVGRGKTYFDTQKRQCDKAYFVP